MSFRFKVERHFSLFKSVKEGKVRPNQIAKGQIVEEIKAKIQKAKSIVFVDYRGLTVAEDTALRTQFRKAGADYKIYKNRLVLRALKECGYDLDEKLFEGTLACAFGFDDEVSPAKILKETIAKSKKMEIKFGVLNGAKIETAEVNALADLPSKEVLVAKLLSVLNGPATQLANVLIAPVRSLATALDAIANKN